MKKTLLTICIIGIILGVGYFFYSEIRDKALAGAIYPKNFTDLIGTRTGSTTTGVQWNGSYIASTTYPFALFNATKASIVFKVTAASTTVGSNPGLRFNIIGSNDPQCATASTTTKYNQMTKSDIMWFDASNYLNGASVITALSNGTTTYAWPNLESGLAKEIQLVDLNMECLAVEVNASSTALYAHYKLKANE